MITPRRMSDFSLLPLREAVDRLFEQAFTAYPTLWSERPGPLSVPMNVYEAPDHFVVWALLPGIKPEDVQITVEQGTLTIAGEFKPFVKEGWKPLFQEIGSGYFRREFRLPTEIDAAKVEATYEHGVLTLKLPKAEAARPKTIKVKVAG
jgi:HSP20 family protein